MSRLPALIIFSCCVFCSATIFVLINGTVVAGPSLFAVLLISLVGVFVLTKEKKTCLDSREEYKITVAKLKINIKSLQQEARDNRKEAAKLSGMDKWQLNHHRTTVIRREARVTNWLYAFVRGRSRDVIEKNRKELDHYSESLLIKRVTAKCKKFDIPWDDFLRWYQATG